MTTEAAHNPRIPGFARRLISAAVIMAFVSFVIWGLWLATRPVSDQLEGMVDTDQVNAATKVLSRIDRFLVEEGDHVKAGQTLAILESPEVTARGDQAQAALNGAQALQARAKAGDRTQDIAALEATWKSVKAQADLAAITAGRSDTLFSEGVIPAQRRDDADAARTAAAQLAEAARQQYLKGTAGTRMEDRRVIASQVATAQAGVRESAALRKETRLVASISGEVDKRFANAGEIVLPGVPVFTLIDLNDLWVSVNLREDEYQGMAQGRLLRGSVPALGVKDIAFKVDYVRPQGDFATWRSTRQSSGYDVRSFEVRARPLKPVNGLRPGMSVLFGWPQK